MSPAQIEKIKRFVNDTATADAVYTHLLNCYLKSRPNQDVYVLAASRLAIDFLNQSWKELEQLKNSEKKVGEKENNIGL